MISLRKEKEKEKCLYYKSFLHFLRYCIISMSLKVRKFCEFERVQTMTCVFLPKTKTSQLCNV